MYTFRSMLHFWFFFQRVKHVFNAAYKPNRPYYLRPRSEFDDLRKVLNVKGVRFNRVYSPFRYAAPADGIPTISMEEFLRR